GALSDPIQSNQKSSIARFYRRSDLTNRHGQSAQRRFRADPFYGREQLEKLLVLGPKKPDQSRLKIAAIRIAFKIHQRMKRDLLAKKSPQRLQIGRWHHQFKDHSA